MVRIPTWFEMSNHYTKIQIVKEKYPRITE